MKNSINIMYHDVYIKSPQETGFQSKGANIYKVLKEDFEKQICSLVKLKEEYEIRLTFDDGGVSFFSTVAPILEKYGFKGWFFISTDFIGTKGFLNKNQIQELSIRGHEIGPHSCSHPEDMTKLDIDEIYLEWKNSKKIIEDIINKQVNVASIPAGFFNKKIIEIMSSLGIQNIFTSIPEDKVREHKKTQLFGRYAIQNRNSNTFVVEIVNSKGTRQKMYARWYFLNVIRKILGKNYFKLRSVLINKID